MVNLDWRRAGVGKRNWRMTSGSPETLGQPTNGIIGDIIEGIRDHLAGIFEGVSVIVGFPDERVNGEAERTYPCICISLIGKDSDIVSKYGGVGYIREDSPDEKTAELRLPPIPIQLHFQIDTLAETRRDDWALTEIVLPFLEARVTVTTAAGREVFLTPISSTNLDGLEDGLWRKTYRAYVTAWFPHPAEPVVAYLVNELQIQNGNEIIKLSE